MHGLPRKIFNTIAYSERDIRLLNTNKLCHPTLRLGGVQGAGNDDILVSLENWSGMAGQLRLLRHIPELDSLAIDIDKLETVTIASITEQPGTLCSLAVHDVLRPDNLAHFAAIQQLAGCAHRLLAIELAARPAGTPVTALVAGVIHWQAAPGCPPFVKLGERVDKGQPLCLLEVAKTFSTIDAPNSGVFLGMVPPNGDTVSEGDVICYISDVA